jgi:hypothetical protein
MKAFAIALVAAGVLLVRSDPVVAQANFQPKTISVPELRVTGVRDYAPEQPEDVFTGPMTINLPRLAARGFGVPVEPFRPKSISVPELGLTGYLP